MMKAVCFLFLGMFHLALGMDAIDNRENYHPNKGSEECIVLYDKKPAPDVERNVQKIRTPQEIKKTIRDLKAQARGYRHFYYNHHKEIERLKELHFFDNSFPKGNKEALDILESIFTNDHGKKNTWDCMTFNFVFHSQRFMDTLESLRADIANIHLETNEEIRNNLSKVDESFRLPCYMIVYYWNNTP